MFLLFSNIVEDFCFYCTHRLLHVGFLYKYVHKVHHEFINPVGLSGEYAHPIEFIFGNLLSSGMPLMILGKNIHAFSVFVWTAFRVLGGVAGHSGYDFKWAPFGLFPF
jgi:sterol desaturase/sphingolipid hydroxylase (fatty acid hydroxylase superfamily)